MKKLPKVRRKANKKQDSQIAQFEEVGEITKKRILPATKYSQKELAGKATHHTLSVTLPVATYLMVAIFHLPWLALALVLLSKWQIFAVKPRFWWANLKFSAIDIIFKLSILGITLLAELKMDSLVNTKAFSLQILQVALAGLYLFWNLYLRKQTSPMHMRAQALLSQFLGLTLVAWASGFSGPDLPLALTVALSWIVVYSAAQHALYAYEESAIAQIASFWALVATSLSFLQLIWAQNFLLFSSLLYVPLMPFVISGLFFLGASTHSYIEDTQTEDIPKTKLNQEKELLTKQAGAAVGISLFLALLIMFR